MIERITHGDAELAVIIRRSFHNDGIAERALFIVGANSVVRYSYVSELRVNPGADGLLQRLEQLQAAK